jgi:acetyl esterase
MKRLFFLCSLYGVVACAAPGARRTDVEYDRAAGESLRLDAFVPDGPGPHPAVILIHGGGWRRGDRSYVAPLHAPLEGAGFAWFSISYRLAPKHHFPAQVEDVEAAVRWLKANATELKVDGRRVVLCGESAGGHLAALAAVRADASTQVAAVVTFYAPVDFTRMQLADGAKLPPIIAAFFGRQTMDDSVRALFREASPLPQVKPGLPPFLLLHGTADTEIPFDRSTSMLARLTEARVSCELVAVDGGDHGMDSWDPVATGYQTTLVAWLRKALGLKS